MKTTDPDERGDFYRAAWAARYEAAKASDPAGVAAFEKRATEQRPLTNRA